MKHRLLLIILLGATACAGDPVVGDFSVSPLPKTITTDGGAPFVFSRRTDIQAPA